jgi:hypothetical protein
MWWNFIHMSCPKLSCVHSLPSHVVRDNSSLRANHIVTTEHGVRGYVHIRFAFGRPAPVAGSVLLWRHSRIIHKDVPPDVAERRGEAPIHETLLWTHGSKLSPYEYECEDKLVTVLYLTSIPHLLQDQISLACLLLRVKLRPYGICRLRWEMVTDSALSAETR